MDLDEVLRDAGLTRNEVKVYLSLLKIGSSTAGKIARLANLSRTSTYEALRSLIEKGLVSYVIKENKKWFSPTNPKRILDYIKEKESKLQEILPRLIGMYKTPIERSQVNVYYGLKGVKSVLLDIANRADENRVLDAEVKFTERMPYFSAKFKSEIERKKVKIKHIARKGVDVHPTATTEVRYLDLKTESPVAINIYDDKIAIIIWSDVPMAVVIENELAAKAYREYFDILWKFAKP